MPQPQIFWAPFAPQPKVRLESQERVNWTIMSWWMVDVEASICCFSQELFLPYHSIASTLEVSCSIFLHEGTWSPWLLPGRRKRTNSESARYMFHESFMPFSQCHEVEVLATPMLNIKAHSIICLEMIECQHHRRRTSCNLSGWKIHPRRPPDFLRFWEFHGSHGNVSRRDQSPNYLMCSHVQPSQRQKTDVACKTVTLTKKAVYIQHGVFQCAESVFQTDWTDLPRIIYFYT